MPSYSRVLDKDDPVPVKNKLDTSSRHSKADNVPETTSIQSSLDDILEDTLVNVRLAEPLTKRESEILKLIVAGNTNKKIAEKFYRTERTIEYHRNRLMRKLNAKTAADMVRHAILMELA